MTVAFLGKGGSGKTTMALGFVRYLRTRGVRVLAIDADHNMDLAYALAGEPRVCFGHDPDAIKECVGASRGGTFGAALKRGRERGHSFTLFPPDAYTEAFSAEVESGLRIMTSGPHTERVRAQEACSHSLAAPLKVYLPLLRLAADEAVVIDERAGTDPVATGILPSVDLAVIVREPTPNSARVAQHIHAELSLAGVPTLFVENKVHGVAEDTARAARAIEMHVAGV